MGDEFNKFGEWEDAWQQAFEGSEHTPPARVWQGLENSLMEQQLRRYKRKLFVYQWLAAASVMLLGFWAGWWLFFAQPAGDVQSISSNELQPAVTAPAAEQAGLSNSNNAASGLAGAAAPAEADQLEKGVSAPAYAAKGRSSVISAAPQGNAATAANSSKTTYPALPSAEPGLPSLDGSSLLEDATTAFAAKPGVAAEQLVAPVLQELPVNPFTSAFYPDPQISGLVASIDLENGLIERELHVVAITGKKKKKRNVSLNGDMWLGASLASSFFDPNVEVRGSHSLAWTDEPVSAKGDQMYSTNASAWDQKESSLPSVNFSLDAAFRIGRRWILQSSLEYGTFRVGTLSGTFTNEENNTAYPLYYTNFSYDKLQVVNRNSRRSGPVSALNTYNFVSVPLVFNYILFERQVGISVGTGVSTDVFLGGQLMDQDERLEAYEIGAGKHSPFNRLYLNGLVSAQLFYRAGPDHLFTLEPTYKHSLTNFNKRISYFDSRPRQFGIAVGFRYILH